ncbi:TIGR04086 family membrane protein [Paludifilum halophilum]|uniref:TIGR04086 family membrane protein n=1 Tax=Paludifilum halophilum TaxID=1642702 RepID=A0A235BCH4_9BACL|nr:TIGR04086 family membrane protein [Paludifilum halophilum]OYD09902.1 TIGR04086 family membrane protein [Paludifilum halophilum]
MKQPAVSPHPFFKNPVLLGVAVVLGLVLAGSVITALILRFTSVPESSMPYFTSTVNGIALLTGGWMSGRRAEQRGWLYGGLTGILYVGIVFVVGFLAFDTAIRVQPVLLTLCAAGLGAIGGIFGVNTGKR